MFSPLVYIMLNKNWILQLFRINTLVIGKDLKKKKSLTVIEIMFLRFANDKQVNTC